jgi:uncharacterized membrane protein
MVDEVPAAPIVPATPPAPQVAPASAQIAPQPPQSTVIPPKLAANNLHYILAFLIPLVTGIIVFLIDPDKKVKLYAVQAAMLGIIIIVIAIIGGGIEGVVIASSVASFNPYSIGSPAAFGTAYLIGTVFELINLVIWLFGLYVGYQAYIGKDVTIPVITDMAKKFAV